jgi:hypothetical protein
LALNASSPRALTRRLSKMTSHKESGFYTQASLPPTMVTVVLSCWINLVPSKLTSHY